jgi:hypothetical protein
MITSFDHGLDFRYLPALLSLSLSLSAKVSDSIMFHVTAIPEIKSDKQWDDSFKVPKKINEW